MDCLPLGGRRDGERDVGDGRYADLLEQIDALLDIDAKGFLAPHGIGGLARELLTKSVAAITALEADNRRVWDALKLSDADTRQWFIGDLVRKHGHFNRSDICGTFKVSVPQASEDIKRWVVKNPNRITYNTASKRYERLA